LNVLKSETRDVGQRVVRAPHWLNHGLSHFLSDEHAGRPTRAQGWGGGHFDDVGREQTEREVDLTNVPHGNGLARRKC